MPELIGKLSQLLEKTAWSKDHFRAPPEIWWRGQADQSAWKLEPGIFRSKRPHDLLIKQESSFYARFMQFAPTRYENCPGANEIAKWLFLMQHYGLKTRLLDWTTSPLTALYFAVNQENGKNGVLWALNPLQLNFSQTKVSNGGLFLPHSMYVEPVLATAFSGRVQVHPETNERIDLKTIAILHNNKSLTVRCSAAAALG